MFYTEKRLRMFAELEDSEKEKVVGRELPEYRRECFKSDYKNYKEMIEIELINLGFSDIEVYYTGFYTGNDGLQFTGGISGSNFNEFLKRIGYKIEEDLMLSLNNSLKFMLVINHLGAYHNEKNVNIDITYNRCFAEVDEAVAEKYLDDIEDAINYWYVTFCTNWYYTLKLQYDCYDDEVAITEYLSEDFLFDDELNKYNYSEIKFYQVSRDELMKTIQNLNKITEDVLINERRIF